MELPFKTPELKEAWNEWLLERKDRKLKKYTERGLKKITTHLLNLSGHDETIAVKIIDQSITLGWQGLFPLKNIPHGTNRTTDNASVRPEKPTRFDAFANWVNGNPASSN